MPHQSILAHLAPLLTNQLENVATEALAHLLLEYPVVSDAFREYVCQAGIDLPDSLKFNTQARGWQDTAIPDLVGLDDEGRYILIVESKFWAVLTPNQPETYIKRMPAGMPAILLFIAPASRLLTLWQELLDRSQFHPSTGQPQVAKTTQFYILQMADQHILALTAWESVLAVLYQKTQQAGEEYASGDIWQLQSLGARIDAEAFQPLTSDEVISPTEKRINQFRGLVNEIVARLVDSGIISTKGYHPASGPGFYRSYFSVHGSVNWCVEYNDEYRKWNPPANLCLKFPVVPQFANLLDEFADKGHSQYKWFHIPLEIPTGLEREAVLTCLVTQVKEIATRLVNE
jgi:hypothetical protein